MAATGSISTSMRPASLKPYKSDTSPNRPWCVDIPPHLSDTGKRKRKFFETQDEAKAECETLKARRDNFGISLTAMTPARIAEAAEAFKLLAPYGTGLIDATRDYIKRHTEKTASKPWKEVFAEYLAMPKKRSAKYSRDLKEAQESMRAFDERLIVEISAPEIDKALSGFAPSTRNAKLRVLRAIFNLGIKRGYLAENPIARLDFAELDTGEVEVFTVDQTDALLKAALRYDPELLPFFVFGFFCGIRPDGELQKLEWSRVHLADKQIVIPPEIAKTKRRRFVDISDNAITWLEAYRKKGGSFAGKVVPLAKSLLAKRRRALQSKAKVEKWIQQGMRHSFCSYWLMKHEDANKLVLQSGHTDADTMWERYHRGVTKVNAKKFWAIRPKRPKPGNIIQFKQSA
jgi:integrase